MGVLKNWCHNSRLERLEILAGITENSLDMVPTQDNVGYLRFSWICELKITLTSFRHLGCWEKDSFL